MSRKKSFDVEHALDRAMHLFWSRGYEATSMQDLVDGMGISRASLYATFGDKRRLFLTALKRYDDRCRRSRLAELERIESPRAAITTLFEGWIDQSLADESRSGCFLTNTALELAVHDPEIGAVVAASQEETEGFFTQLIEKGQARGEIRADLDVNQVARTLLAALLGLLVLARSRPERALLESIARSATTIL